jgi:hypothetical protein
VDLIALVAACSLTVDPKLMHALVWHQSGGEPWSFSVPAERQASALIQTQPLWRCSCRAPTYRPLRDSSRNW